MGVSSPHVIAGAVCAQFIVKMEDYQTALTPLKCLLSVSSIGELLNPLCKHRDTDTCTCGHCEPANTAQGKTSKFFLKPEKECGRNKH